MRQRTESFREQVARANLGWRKCREFLPTLEPRWQPYHRANGDRFAPGHGDVFTKLAGEVIANLHVLQSLGHHLRLHVRALAAELAKILDVIDRRHRSEEHTSELQSLRHLVCRLLLE